MHRVLVVGSVNHDRIWRLEAPLVPGGRLQVRDKTVQLGGGGFHTGSALLELGAGVVLVSRLMQDALGLSALEALRELGFETQHVELLAGETEPPDILLDPGGERTILFAARASRQPLRLVAAPEVAAAYVNALGLDDGLRHVLAQIPLVISQLPLRPATVRPADYVVSSRADVGPDVGAVWTRATALAGSRLKALVVTDGPRPVTIHDGTTSVTVATKPVDGLRSSIGAGDRFCGALALALLDGLGIAGAVAMASGRTADWLARQPRA
ncbi:PfkB family carbohydrate kinase [Labrys wisconsinensis]|uniref:Sugar/nucleoside kinase (Ribokinase family) n=1 Tax=Labrys wisconsinensis TaxID=425677 RepID=A0ABU0JI25_9HYPH|nr:PfkB family carbohydrate kinase [Labrys wisconsinensis]MDQ0473068.1 sugar/nucleoside kinase (ribokinase family) [Labrys wisconsinensis]